MQSTHTAFKYQMHKCLPTYNYAVHCMTSSHKLNKHLTLSGASDKY